jgi:hypothetical protein
VHKTLLILSASVLLVDVTALAAEHQRTAGRQEFVDFSGFEGQEQQLGGYVAAAIMEASPTRGPEHDFTSEVREERLGYAVSTAIRTINLDAPYVHETNDALVKMTLSYIQFAKDNNMSEEMVAKEMEIQYPQLIRVKGLIDKTGDKSFALKAVTDRTTCFYQLVDIVEDRDGTSITYKAPYGNVIAVTQKTGQFDLTEEEVHELWTIPRFKGYGKIMGVDLEVSDWDDSGLVTVRIAGSDKIAMN